jgi:hypothetical protein
MLIRIQEPRGHPRNAAPAPARRAAGVCGCRGEGGKEEAEEGTGEENSEVVATRTPPARRRPRCPALSGMVRGDAVSGMLSAYDMISYSSSK